MTDLGRLTIINLDQLVGLDKPGVDIKEMKRPPRVTIAWGEDLPRFVSLDSPTTTEPS